MSDRRDIAFSIDTVPGAQEQWELAHAAWVDACTEQLPADQQCSICGSLDPATTVGWPVCANRWFHDRTRRGWAAYRYRGAHRPAAGRRTVAELELELLPPFTFLSPEAAYIGSYTMPFRFFGVVPDPDPATITGTLTLEPPGSVMTIPALLGDGGPHAVPASVDPGMSWAAAGLSLVRADQVDCSGAYYYDDEED